MTIALAITLFCATNLPWNLDDYDQAKQAFTSYEMVQEGHWFFQHTPSEKIATKPPLVGWVSALIYSATHWWNGAWRLPSMGAAVALLWILGRACNEAYGSWPGLLAMGAFGLNLMSPRLATLVRTDMPLALVIFLLGWQIWRKIRSQERWTQRDRAVAAGLLTASMLIKGPIVYAFLLPGLIAFQFLQRRKDGGGNAWSGWWPWVLSLGVFLLWAGLGIQRVPGFREQVVIREFAGRFEEGVHRAQPLYFYLPHLLHKFAPWSLLMIGLAVARYRTRKRDVMEKAAMNPAVLWLICWSFGGLIIMSLVPSKRVDRIFPVIPPLCLLLGAQVAACAHDPKLWLRVRHWSVVCLIAAGVLSSGYSVQKIVVGWRERRGSLAEFGERVRARAPATEVLWSKDEGMLLYLRRSHFLGETEAVARWRDGSLKTLVVPAAALNRFADAKVLLSEGESNQGPARYFLLGH